MKLYLDTSSWQLSTAPGGSNTTVIIPAKHGTDLLLEIFPSSPLAPGTLGTLVAKPKDEYTSASVSWDLAWDSPGTSLSGYIFRLPLTTAPLAALFTTGVKSLQLMAEITISSGGSVSKTQTIAISVAREVSGGEAGTPEALPDYKASQAEAEAGTDNSTWMTPLRTAQAIRGNAPRYDTATITESDANLRPVKITLNLATVLVGTWTLTYDGPVDSRGLSQLSTAVLTHAGATLTTWTLSYVGSSFNSAVQS